MPSLLLLLGTLLAASSVPPESIIPANAQQAARYYLQTGDALASWGALEPALRNYRKALEKDPALPGSRLHLGRALAALGLVMPALEQVQLILRETPQDRDAGLLYGQLLLQSGKPREAELAVRPLVERDGRDARARRALGITLLAQEQAAKAIEEFRQATRDEPQNADGFKFLAQALLAHEETGEAALALQKYLVLRPGDLPAAMTLLEVLLQLDRRTEAVGLGQRLVESWPGNAPLLMGVAGELVKVTRRAEAAKLYERVLTLEPTPEMVLMAANFLAEYRASQGRFRDAAQWLRRVIALRPELLPARLMLLRMYTLAGDWTAAAGAARALAALNPEHLGFRMQVFEAQLRAGQYGAALATARAVLGSWPRDPGLVETLAGGLLRAGQPGRAMQLVQQAQRRAPDYRPFGYLLYQLYRRLGRDDAAEALVQRLLVAWPDDPLVRLEAGVQACDEQRYGRAVELLEPLAARRQISAEGYYALAWALEKTGRYLDAAALYQNYATARQQPTLLLNVARQFEALNDGESALGLYDKILAAVPGHLPTQLARGRLLGNLGRFAEAAEGFEAILAKQPDNALAWRSLALARTALGELAAAEAAYRQLAEVDPDNDYAVALIGQTQREQRRVDAAIETWLAGLRKHPDSAVLHRQLAEAYRAEDNYPEALAHYTAAARAEPHDFTTLLAGAVASEEVGLFDQARAWYREALETGPEAALVYRRWLATFAAEGTPQLGTQAGLQLLQRRPGSDLLADAVMDQAVRSGDLAWFRQQVGRLGEQPGPRAEWQDLEGRARLAAGDAGGAADWYGELSRAEPRVGRWRWRAGEVAEQAGELGAARREYEAASRLEPGRAEPLEGLARVQQSTGRDDDAMLTLRRLMTVAPESPTGFEQLVRLYERQGRVAEVREGLRQLLFEPPPLGKPEYREQAGALAAYGLACELSGDAGTAVQAYTQALSRNAWLLSARLGLDRLRERAAARPGLSPAR